MDLILSRYNTYVMELDICVGIELISKAYEEKANEMIWDMWLAKYPWMDETSFISFEDFKNGLLKDSSSPKRSKEDILKEVEEIVKADKTRYKGGGNSAAI